MSRFPLPDSSDISCLYYPQSGRKIDISQRAEKSSSNIIVIGKEQSSGSRGVTKFSFFHERRLKYRSFLLFSLTHPGVSQQPSMRLSRKREFHLHHVVRVVWMSTMTILNIGKHICFSFSWFFFFVNTHTGNPLFPSSLFPFRTIDQSHRRYYPFLHLKIAMREGESSDSNYCYDMLVLFTCHIVKVTCYTTSFPSKGCLARGKSPLAHRILFLFSFRLSAEKTKSPTRKT